MNKTTGVFVVLAFVLSCLMSFRYGHNQGQLSSQYKLDSTQVKYDTVTYDAQINVRDSTNIVDSIVVITIIDTIPFTDEIDTNAIVSNYFVRRETEVKYQDSNIVLNIRPVIVRNSLDSISFNYRLLRPTQVNYLSPKGKYEWYVGLSAGRMNVSPYLQVNIKDKYLVGVNYNLLQGGVGFSAGVRLF